MGAQTEAGYRDSYKVCITVVRFYSGSNGGVPTRSTSNTRKVVTRELYSAF